MGLLEKIATRRSYPLELDPGNTIQLCSLEIDEIERADVLPDKLKNPFILGCSLCEDNGDPAFTKVEKPDGAMESDAEFAIRVKDRLREAKVRTDTVIKITRTIGMLGTVDRESIAKN